ncbi:MAG: hypothetical protein KGK04_15760, partial [Xanthomonadaceae bacterium]|nr:hypothetical protein [Xanthomonadaceae bacterium]
SPACKVDGVARATHSVRYCPFSRAARQTGDAPILLVIPAKAGIQRLQAIELKGAGFLLTQE